jgi:hypothetical protein
LYTLKSVSDHITVHLINRLPLERLLSYLQWFKEGKDDQAIFEKIRSLNVKLNSLVPHLASKLVDCKV